MPSEKFTFTSAKNSVIKRLYNSHKKLLGKGEKSPKNDAKKKEEDQSAAPEKIAVKTTDLTTTSNSDCSISASNCDDLSLSISSSSGNGKSSVYLSPDTPISDDKNNITIIEVGDERKVEAAPNKLKIVIENFDKILNEYHQQNPGKLGAKPKLVKSKTCSIIESKCILKKNPGNEVDFKKKPLTKTKSLFNLDFDDFDSKKMPNADILKLVTDFGRKLELENGPDKKIEEKSVKEIVKEIDSLNTKTFTKKPKGAKPPEKNQKSLIPRAVSYSDLSKKNLSKIPVKSNLNKTYPSTPNDLEKLDLVLGCTKASGVQKSNISKAYSVQNLTKSYSRENLTKTKQSVAQNKLKLVDIKLDFEQKSSQSIKSSQNVKIRDSKNKKIDVKNDQKPTKAASNKIDSIKIDAKPNQADQNAPKKIDQNLSNIKTDQKNCRKTQNSNAKMKVHVTNQRNSLKIDENQRKINDDLKVNQINQISEKINQKPKEVFEDFDQFKNERNSIKSDQADLKVKNNQFAPVKADRNPGVKMRSQNFNNNKESKPGGISDDFPKKQGKMSQRSNFWKPIFDYENSIEDDKNNLKSTKIDDQENYTGDFLKLPENLKTPFEDGLKPNEVDQNLIGKLKPSKNESAEFLNKSKKEIDQNNLKPNKIDQNNLKSNKIDQNNLRYNNINENNLKSNKIDQNNLKSNKIDHEKKGDFLEPLENLKVPIKNDSNPNEVDQNLIECAEFLNLSCHHEEVDQNNLKSNKVDQNNLKSNKVDQNNLKSNKVDQNNLKSNKIDRNNLKSNKIDHEKNYIGGFLESLENLKTPVKNDSNPNEVDQNLIESAEFLNQSCDHKEVGENNLKPNKVDQNNLKYNKVGQNNLKCNKIDQNNLKSNKIDHNNLKSNKIDQNNVKSNEIDHYQKNYAGDFLKPLENLKAPIKNNSNPNEVDQNLIEKLKFPKNEFKNKSGGNTEIDQRHQKNYTAPASGDLSKQQSENLETLKVPIKDDSKLKEIDENLKPPGNLKAPVKDDSNPNEIDQNLIEKLKSSKNEFKNKSCGDKEIDQRHQKNYTAPENGENFSKPQSESIENLKISIKADSKSKEIDQNLIGKFKSSKNDAQNNSKPNEINRRRQRNSAAPENGDPSKRQSMEHLKAPIKDDSKSKETDRNSLGKLKSSQFKNKYRNHNNLKSIEIDQRQPENGDLSKLDKKLKINKSNSVQNLDKLSPKSNETNQNLTRNLSNSRSKNLKSKCSKETFGEKKSDMEPKFAGGIKRSGTYTKSGKSSQLKRLESLENNLKTAKKLLEYSDIFDENPGKLLSEISDDNRSDDSGNISNDLEFEELHVIPDSTVIFSSAESLLSPDKEERSDSNFSLNEAEKIFFRSGILTQLESQRDEKLAGVVVSLQANCRGYLARKKLTQRKLQDLAVRCIQRNVRKFMLVRDWPWWRLLVRVTPLLNVHRTEEELKLKTEELEALKSKLEKIEAERNSLKNHSDKLEAKLSEMTADLAEEHSTSTLAAERLDVETAERIRLERELNDMQQKNKELQNTSEKLEMELLYARSDLNNMSDDDDDAENEPVYKQRYERVLRELEFTKRRLHQQHEDDLEQLVGLKKQLEKKLTDAYEEVEEQRQVVGQWKRKVQKLTSEMGDIKLLLEEQTSRNNILEKKQRKFDSELQGIQEELKKERSSKDRLGREKELLTSEKFTLESTVADLRMELDMKEEKLQALQKELDELTFGGKTEEEVTVLRKQKIDCERRLHDQDEELDELAGQVQLLEQAKLKLEMSLEQQRKSAKKEAQQHDEELEEVRCNAQKKVKALEAQLENEHEERTVLLREKHELERRLANALENDRNDKAVDEAVVQRLKRDLKRTKALLRDTQMQLERQRAENPSKTLIRQLRNQIDDLECARSTAVKTKQALETDLSETQAQLEETSRLRSDLEERYNATAREKADLQNQVEENEEELAEVLKKYKTSVQQMSLDQIALQEQVALVSELEAEKAALRDQLAEMSSRLETVENMGDASSNMLVRRGELKVKELEHKLDLEQTTRQRLEVQIARLKEAVEKLQNDLGSSRNKEQQAQEQIRKLQRSIRELREEHNNALTKEGESILKRKELEKKYESLEAETTTIRADLRLALKRIEDLQAVIQNDLEDTTENSDSEIDSLSSEDSVNSFLKNHKLSIKPSTMQIEQTKTRSTSVNNIKETSYA